MTLEIAGERRVLISTDWAGYEKIVEAVGDAPSVRLTFSGGSLEIMTTGHEHELLKKLIGGLMELFMDEFHVAYEPGGAETFKKQSLEKGFEPDECYWTVHRASMLGVKRWDPATHPPPDVAIEIEITHGLVPRLPIYASLGVPEVWHYHDDRIDILLLEDGIYVVAPSSPTLPLLSTELLMRYARMSQTQLTSDIRRLFREEIRGLHGSQHGTQPSI